MPATTPTLTFEQLQRPTDRLATRVYTRCTAHALSRLLAGFFVGAPDLGEGVR